MTKHQLNIIHIVIPVLLILILPFIPFTTSDDLIAKGLIMNTLIVYYPIIFLLQGAACSFLKTNIFISLGLSIVMFIIALLIWMNSSALFYIIVYSIIWLIGYGLVYLLQKRKK